MKLESLRYYDSEYMEKDAFWEEALQALKGLGPKVMSPINSGVNKVKSWGQGIIQSKPVSDAVRKFNSSTVGQKTMAGVNKMRTFAQSKPGRLAINGLAAYGAYSLGRNIFSNNNS